MSACPWADRHPATTQSIRIFLLISVMSASAILLVFFLLCTIVHNTKHKALALISMILISSALALLYVASSNMSSQSQAPDYDPKTNLAWKAK